ncbi:MAG: NAD-dependent epimerase/dehydratase family protein [Oligosphaeraceae bacterium]|nr:NAD-dependent epimerase/dehydratase family protein [Oligosphaeraceae bacterium]
MPHKAISPDNDSPQAKKLPPVKSDMPGCCLETAPRARYEKIKGLAKLRILILGGSGFVSGAIVRRALALGHEVSCVTRGRRPLPPKVQAIQADRTVPGELEIALQNQSLDYDLVVDCIGYKAADARQDITLFSKHCRHLAFISSDFVYDPSKRQFPQPEDNPYFLTDDSYGAHKRRCELEFLHAEPHFSRWSIYRPCHIYGPGSRLGCLPKHGRDPRLLERLLKEQPLALVGAGKYLQQPIFVDDLAELILSSVFSPCCNAQFYNCAGPDIIESVRYYEILAELLQRRLNVEEIPVMHYLHEYPEHKSFLCHRIYDLAKIQQDCLAMPQTPIEKGLQIHLESLSEQ